MANPLYGLNRTDSRLKTIADSAVGGLTIGAHKVLNFNISVTDTASGVTAQDGDSGQVIPAGSLIKSAAIINIGSVALAANALTWDVGGTDLTASLSGLAAGACKSADIDDLYIAAETPVLCDGGSGAVVGAGTTTLKVIVHYIDINAVNV